MAAVGTRAWLLLCCLGCRVNFDERGDALDAPTAVPLSVQSGFVDLPIGSSSRTLAIAPVAPAHSLLTFSLEVRGAGDDDVRIEGALAAAQSCLAAAERPSWP